MFRGAGLSYSSSPSPVKPQRYLSISLITTSDDDELEEIYNELESAPPANLQIRLCRGGFYNYPEAEGKSRSILANTGQTNEITEVTE